MLGDETSCRREHRHLPDLFDRAEHVTGRAAVGTASESDDEQGADQSEAVADDPGRTTTTLQPAITPLIAHTAGLGRCAV